MAYKALYRTYRPSSFDEVAGQTHVVKTLKNALASGKLAHAYLFAGPRGTGKTSMAKLLAKALNCDEGIGCQCNECKNCKAINDGTHPDVLEIDAASNSGVDEIRELIDRVKYGTILGKYKVYIIDEVHMMTSSAFNALLKTLEEPPTHVIFILATTEPHKILPTILSRCQRYDFTRLSNHDIKERIRVVLSKSEIDFNDDAVNLIVSLADGGMRDALSILDQVLAYSGDHLNVEDILDMFALESKEEKLQLINSIIRGDVSNVLDRLTNYIKKGTDLRRLINDLLLMLKDVLIFKTSKNTSFLQALNSDEVTSISPKLDNTTTMNLINILMDTLKDIKNVSSINPLVELAFIKMTVEYKKDDVINSPVVEPEIKELPVTVQPVDVKLDTKVVEEKETSATIEVPSVDETIEEKKDQEIIKEQAEEQKEEVSCSYDVPISDSIIEIEDTRQDELFLIKDEVMLPIMILSKKDYKNNFLEHWKDITRYIGHPTLGKYASMLIDGHTLVASSKVLVVEFQLQKNVEIVNRIENQKYLQALIDVIFNNKVFVYAVSRSESVRLQQYYMNLLQLGKLKKPDQVSIKFVGEE